MSELNLNRERRALLEAIRRGRVYTSVGGHLMVRTGDRAQNRHCVKAVRELQAAGFVAEQLVGGQPILTDAGKAAIA